jgi:Fe-S cluster assembly protein SufD
MTHETTLKARCLLAFRNLEKRSDWLQKLRSENQSRFASMEFPTTKDEAWKYTSLVSLLETPFVPLNGSHEDEINQKIIYKYAFTDIKRYVLVFINGRFSAEYSQLSDLQEGLILGSLPEIASKFPEKIEPWLEKIAVHERSIFTEMNGAFLNDGAAIIIPDNMEIAEPIHLMFLTTNHREPFVVQPRNLIVMGRNSSATLIETYDALEHNSYFTNTVTETVLGENASLSHHKLQLESRKAFHIGTNAALLNRDARYLNTFISLGGQLSRNNLDIKLDAPGADAQLFGLYMGKEQQHIDNSIFMHHHKEHTTSNQVYKSILDDQSRGVFNGQIYVDKDAQKVNAYQLNKNLLLSPEAKADTKPQLKIFADDVKCSHGATVGQLDENSLFYLRSRGISKSVARSMLTYAYASDIIESIIVGSVRFYLYSVLLNRLGQGWDQVAAGE